MATSPGGSTDGSQGRLSPRGRTYGSNQPAHIRSTPPVAKRLTSTLEVGIRELELLAGRTGTPSACPCHLQRLPRFPLSLSVFNVPPSPLSVFNKPSRPPCLLRALPLPAPSAPSAGRHPQCQLRVYLPPLTLWLPRLSLETSPSPPYWPIYSIYTCCSI